MAFQHETFRQERFSLLLLEPGEIYFDDFSVNYYPVDHDTEDINHVNEKRKQRGHLKICSKSAVFVPKEKEYPILKIPLKNVSSIDEYSGNLYSKTPSKDKGFVIKSDVCVEMKKDNIISPYLFKKKEAQHLFELNYVTVEDCLPSLCQLHRASTLPPADQGAMISAIVLSRQSRVKFNTSWLDDLYERIEMESQADKITPLVTNPGRVMVTTSRLYFQPFNNVETATLIRVKLKEIGQIIKRRFLLKQIGLEIICGDSTAQPHLYLAFKTQAERDALYDTVIKQEEVQLTQSDQQDMTLKWQNGVISNFDYLMFLNSAADRSFFDLTQYPVMPWVIQDFSSPTLDFNNPDTFRDLAKPIGALNDERLARMKERYADMPEPKFLYGAHYSTPGYVLFYLSRQAPEYVLCLQNGKFDQPDRMFNSLWDLWQNCLHGAADFKELIPEFYQGNGEFMINSGVCNFGVRQDGRPVGNVDLPPWAASPSDCIHKLREALESDHVSRHINEWIDLIFGYKQRGEEAEKADNVFYYMTYEGAINLDSITDPNERACMEIQIMEFGQVPKQLFTSPHPVRHGPKIERPLLSPSTCKPKREEVERSDNDYSKNGTAHRADFTTLKEVIRFSLHKSAISDVQLCLKKKMAVSVSQDSLFKMYSIEEQRQLRSVPLSNMALSSCLVLPEGKTVIVGSWDNNVYFYSVEYGNVLDTLHAHDDAISHVCWHRDVLYTASWDSTVKVWEFHQPGSQHDFKAAEFVLQLDHENGVTVMALSEPAQRLVSATRDGQVYVWDLATYALHNVFHVHAGTIAALDIIVDKDQIVTCGEDKYLRVLDLESGTEIFVKDMKQTVLCLGLSSSTVLLGLETGKVQVWDMEKACQIHEIKAHNGPVTCLHVSADSSVVTGGEDRSVCLWRPDMR
ncbi:protein FAN-like isoform X2 [Dreissena polymorpha]|uniref:protein FAN-like isoform X2 n=1 Tax=Dreissena polymorpha TaxID=45954 RepID=UPI002264AE45|nr:protein FAN-like isoform X2 [Dreissena polymorpha]